MMHTPVPHEVVQQSHAQEQKASRQNPKAIWRLQKCDNEMLVDLHLEGVKRACCNIDVPQRQMNDAGRGRG